MFLFRRLSKCPLCQKRLISRLNGPLHLNVDDFPASTSANRNQQSKEQSVEQNGIMDNEPLGKHRERAKSMCEQHGEQLQNVANHAATTQIEPLENVQRAAHRGRSHSFPPINSTVGCKTTGRNYDRNVTLASDDSDPPVQNFAWRRQSDRVRNNVQRYNLAEIKCFVCKKKFRVDVPIKFFDGRVACSFKCLRDTF